MKNELLIPDKDLANIRALNAELDTTKGSMVALLEPVSKLVKELSNTSISYKALSAAINQVNAIEGQKIEIEKRVASLEAQLAEAMKKVEAAVKQRSASTKALTQDEHAASIATRDHNREMKLLAEIAAAPIGSLARYRNELKLINFQISKMPKGTEEYNQALLRQKELFSEVTATERSMGNFSRNVGNYASAFNPLNFQVQQIARELPSLTISAQQFFLAISNNLPMFSDELTKASAKYKAYRAAIAEGATDVAKVDAPFKQVLKSMASWQTGLVIGITLLTKYHKEIWAFAKSLVGAGSAAISAEKAFRQVNRAMDFASLGKQLASLSKLQREWNALGDNLQAKEQFIKDNADALKQLDEGIDSVVEVESVLVGNTEEFKNALMQRAAAAAALKLAEDELSKSIEKEVKIEEIANKGRLTFGQSLGQLVQGPFVNSVKDLRDAGEVAKLMAENSDLTLGAAKRVAELRRSQNKAAADSEAYLNVMTKAEQQADKFFSKFSADNVDKVASAQEKRIEQRDDIVRRLMNMPETSAHSSILKARLTILNQEIDAYNKREDAFNSLGIQSKESAKSAEDVAKAYQDLAKDEADALNEMTIAEGEHAAKGFLKAAEDEKASLDKRLSALQDWVAQRKTTIDAAANQQIENEINTTAEKLDLDPIKDREKLEKMLAYTIAAIRQTAQYEYNEIEEQGEKRRLETVENYAEKQAEALTKVAEMRSLGISESESADLAKLAQDFSRQTFKDNNERIVAHAEYEAEKTRVTRKAAYDRYTAEQQNLTDAMKVAGLSEKQLKTLKEQFGKNEIEYRQYVNQQIIEGEESTADKIAEIQESIAEKRRELLSQSVDFAMELAKAFTQSQIDDLEEQEERDNQYYDDERDRVERLYESGAKSKEEADAYKRQLDDEQQQADEKRAQKQKEIERNQFLFEQGVAVARVMQQMAASLAQITALAAVAKINALAQLGPIAGPPAVAAITAAAVAQRTQAIIDAGIQTGIILAQTIPAFAEGTGTEGHRGGWAVVGDGGRPEAIISPMGQIHKTPSVPTLVNMPKGSIVMPDYNDFISRIGSMSIHVVTATEKRQSTDAEVRDAVRDVLSAQRETTKTLKLQIYHLQKNKRDNDRRAARANLKNHKIRS